MTRDGELGPWLDGPLSLTAERYCNWHAAAEAFSAKEHVQKTGATSLGRHRHGNGNGTARRPRSCVWNQTPTPDGRLLVGWGAGEEAKSP